MLIIAGLLVVGLALYIDAMTVIRVSEARCAASPVKRMDDAPLGAIIAQIDEIGRAREKEGRL